MKKEEAIEKLEAFAPFVVDDTRQALDMAIETLQQEPIRHGEWECSQNKEYCIRADFKALVCSICGCSIPKIAQFPKNYCPNCGAKMKGTEE